LDSKWWPLPDPDAYGNLLWRLASYTNESYIRRWGAEFQICVYTGDVDMGGTDLDIDLTLQSGSRSQTFANLDNGNDNFERGSQDCFNVGSYGLSEGLTGLSVYVYNDPDSDSEWFLQAVTVQDYFTGEFWQLPCNCWIDDSSEYDDDIGQTTYGPWLSLQPAY
jgi:hypothetical protein